MCFYEVVYSRTSKSGVEFRDYREFATFEEIVVWYAKSLRLDDTVKIYGIQLNEN